jgi:ABC-type transport system involved in cytochrome c biogenesis permease subunit
MATTASPAGRQGPKPAGSHLATPQLRGSKWDNPLVPIMDALASLRVTVVLFALGIFVILVGTLAQTEMDIWEVVAKYFRAWIMYVDLNLFFPKSFFHGWPHRDLPTLPFPGGMAVGVAMAINLGAAHAWRFKVQASGLRLAGGIVITIVGVIVTTLVILSGNGMGGGIQAKPLLAPSQIWALVLAALAGLWVFYGWLLVRYTNRVFRERKPSLSQYLSQYFELRIFGLFASAFVAYSLLLGGMLQGTIAPNPEGSRILWQLIQGGFAAMVLLAGCILLFKKRAGVVLLHAGVALMMLSELMVARYAVEWQIFLQEGHTTNYLRDIRTTELAIVDPSGEKTDDVFAIPRPVLETNYFQNQALIKAGKEPQPIRDKYKGYEQLPFDVAVLDYYKNADIRDLAKGEQPIATAGRGLKETIVERKAGKGTDMDAGVDLAAAYLKFTEKETGKDLGTYLLSQIASEQAQPERFAEKVKLGDKTYQLYLRFERAYKPYTISLVDVRKDDYLGSDTPKNYSSDIRLVDERNNVDKQIHIKMNDPLRYDGDTFYQSGYHQVPDGNKVAEATTLAVVTNMGWMIPYVACAIVAVGMMAHFSVVLTRFLNRRENEEADDAEEAARVATLEETVPAQLSNNPFATPAARPRKVKVVLPPPALAAQSMPSGPWGWYVPLVVALLFFVYVGSKLRPSTIPAGAMNLKAFGETPIVHSGRVKPLDTLARNSLRALSNYETTKDAKGQRVSATQWLLDVITSSEAGLNYKVIRIDHPDVCKIFGLEPRFGSKEKNLFSVEELRGKIDAFALEAEAARKQGNNDAEKLTAYQRKVIELDERLQLYITLVRSFSPPPLPPLPTQEEIMSDRALAQQKVQAFRLALADAAETLARLKPPLAVPVQISAERDDKRDDKKEVRWMAYPNAWSMAYMQTKILGEAAGTETIAYQNILDAYQRDDVKQFNSEVNKFRALVARLKPPDYNQRKVVLETYFNYVSPFYLGIGLYAIAFVMALWGWLLRWQPLNRGAFTLLVLTFLFHSVALGARIYISGRPPVTNLYSSAVFIGWGAVLFGLCLETIYRMGLGNVVAAITGFGALMVAYFLSAGGDTIAVLQAVLDTQFWLATHVVCVTLGYTATYVAGALGLIYVLFGVATPLVDERMRKDIGRMIYGVVCFAIFFSFVGTVLGGLWADDSWGRFWGWDPKENGALIIVLWNALVLHARWGKMVSDRGLAVLAIGGNIVTSWSWFGVNELGIGLHSYGFTEGVLLALGVFVGSQLLLIVAGMLPKSLWWSFNAGSK